MTGVTAVTGRRGKFAVISEAIARVKNWRVNPTQATHSEWGDSDGGGFTNRATGRRDATFTVEGVYDEAANVVDIFQPGDITITVLWLTTVALDYWYFGSSLCQDFDLVVDIDTEEVLGWTTEWGADGQFFFPGEAGAPSINIG